MTTSQEPIKSFSGEFAFLSNFAPCKIELEGITFPTTEHAFQAAKTFDVAQKRHIALLMTPGKAKRAGRQLTMRPDWERVKVSVMEMILRKKFAQEPFRTQLLATGDRELIEGNNWNDIFWGVCDGEGRNELGKLLMQIREEVK